MFVENLYEPGTGKEARDPCAQRTDTTQPHKVFVTMHVRWPGLKMCRVTTSRR